MKPEIATIISALISNIGQTNKAKDPTYARHIYANRAVDGITKLEELWPNLTQEEKQEFKAVIEAIKITYRDDEKDYGYSSMMHTR